MQTLFPPFLFMHYDTEEQMSQLLLYNLGQRQEAATLTLLLYENMSFLYAEPPRL